MVDPAAKMKLTHRTVNFAGKNKILLDIGAIALSGGTNPTFATVVAPTPWTMFNPDGLGDRGRGRRDRVVTVDTNQVTTEVMFAAKRTPA